MKKWIKPEIRAYRDFVHSNGYSIPAYNLCPLLVAYMAKYEKPKKRLIYIDLRA